MVNPKIESWTGGIVSGANLDATTYGQGTSFPATWNTTRLFWRTDEKFMYQNTGTEGSPTFTAINVPASVKFGDGSDGVKTTTNETFSDGDHKQFTTLTVPISTQLDIAKTIIIYATESITINGTINLNGKGASGGSGASGTSGTAGTAGSSGTSSTPATPSTPGNPSLGTAGNMQNNALGGQSSSPLAQAEVIPNNGTLYTNIYDLYDTMFQRTVNFGAGGNGGGGGIGGTGGRGGTGNPSCGGGNGGNGGSGGTGGTGGGSIFLISPVINIGSSGVIQANGNDAGTANSGWSAGATSCVSGGNGTTGGNGGGGNGGFVMLAYTTKTFTTGYSITVAGGAKSTGGSGGSNGRAGYIKELVI
jgi:hypothetical protein